MYAGSVILRFIIFILGFGALFWFVRFGNFLPEYKLSEDLRSIPTLFAAGNFIYSIFMGFTIQMQWAKWDSLVNANRGEINMLRQLFIVAHHFPVKERSDIRYHIYRYLEEMVLSYKAKKSKTLRYRSKSVDEALIKVEDSMFAASKKYPDIGPQAFAYLTRAMEYREQKLQFINQQLPVGIRIFVIFATAIVIFGSLFLPFTTVAYNFYFTMVLAILAFGVYLIIEDFDHPHQPGIHHLSVEPYKHLKNEIKAKLEEYNYDFERAEERDKNDTFFEK